jgi:hypothetical protein
MIPIFVVIAVLNFVPVFIYLVPVSISIARLSVITSPPVIAVMIVETTVVREALVFAEARIISEACLILPAPFPIFLLALTVQPVVFDVVIAAFGKPLAVVWIILTVVAPIAGIRTALIPMF